MHIQSNAGLVCVRVVVAGLGNIASLCTSRSATVCQEWNEFASVGTAAHELGHKSVSRLHLASILPYFYSFKCFAVMFLAATVSLWPCMCQDSVIVIHETGST